ncbi:MAG: TIGR04282 family arsenosugar biosynthesis glycosyltransferase [candidate division KSB1 bacterium]|nr:TIGR04282 family arsenosugar biosynthesis glycosyltransferase [candidate division KSB1 bacterium]MDZ7273952.1 TIGR04282 family arsenosugar biosynthesis glycosyltransferase [candidate division KSB1 bacterium]MDZ7286108.1 TIGR04282 family arsenosugar biosynthesis glycosyltransferase [candidate division KSB1 bacterium]MDZ7299140.1 TIGR04282 family arsenosugar biosynthesis glycosyltransferase [candidate division KSB1 bacterium]MDZ7308337.1 TIGR04282 family arsenosugar biosynthesis glycosyltransf
MPKNIIQPDTMPTDLALLTFLKFPEPGHVKTRLAAAIGAELAAKIYRHLIQTLFARTASLPARHFAVFTPREKRQALRRMLPGEREWLAQDPSPDLGVRMRTAIQTVLQRGYSRILLIGSDSPDLPLAHLEQAAEALHHHDVVLGPSQDGGYYLIGVKADLPALFENISWSTAAVLQQTLAKTEALGLKVHLLPAWYDVDDFNSLHRYCMLNDIPDRLKFRLLPFFLGRVFNQRSLLA